MNADHLALLLYLLPADVLTWHRQQILRSLERLVDRICLAGHEEGLFCGQCSVEQV